MSWLKNILFTVSASALVLSCEEAPRHTDTLSKGNIDISVDETFKPVIEEQLKIFDSSYPEAKITVHYKPEAECFKDYFDNKARIILVTRDLTKDEKELCSQKKIWPTAEALASDGIAVIVNNESADTLMDINSLTGIL